MRLTAAERDAVWQRDQGRCIWPRCGRLGAEIAHFHSRGMGGRSTANTPTNYGLMCQAHARASDGEYGDRDWYVAEHVKLYRAAGIGPQVPEHRADTFRAWWRAEALTALIGALYPT